MLQMAASRGPSVTATTPPFAPRILNILENSWVHQQFLLVFGQVETASHGQIIVRHHMDLYPATHWPICDNGHFKAFVHLEPGPNKLRFTYKSAKSSTFTTEFTVHMLPLVATPPLHLVLLVAKDSSEEYECQSEKDNEMNGLQTAARKLRMAACVLESQNRKDEADSDQVSWAGIYG